jgi:hypothetical protein
MNINELKLEAYPSTLVVREHPFYVYSVISSDIGTNYFRLLRGICRKIANCNAEIGVFENGKKIITTEEVNSPNDADFELKLEGKQVLPVMENRNVYQEYVRYLISENLKKTMVLDKYRKYACKSEVTSCWIKNEKGESGIYENKNKDIRLERVFDIKVEIRDDGKAYLFLNAKTQFSSKLTVMELLDQGMDVCGMYVKNDWGTNKQSGTVVEVMNKTVSDQLDFGYSLKDYYVKKKNEGYRVTGISDDTPVVRVELSVVKSILPYYPQALKPIITREYVSKHDPEFSVRIDNLVKRVMKDRLKTDVEFINDIGELGELDGLRFQTECCNVKSLGYLYGTINMPKLICGDGYAFESGKDYQAFAHGFYQKPEHALNVGYIYPRGEEELIKQVANDLYSYAVLGKYHGEIDKYVKKNLLDVNVSAAMKISYDVGKITDYKRAAYKLREAGEVDIVIALIPEELEDDNPYSPFKRIWAEMNIPSQMISLKTARLFVQSEKDKDDRAKYYLQNIVLGILGKTGGIPWIIERMPAGVDCFVGLDVAMMDKGLHCPACSVVFDSHGRLLGFFKPRMPQRGEKITARILQDIFDQVILSYEEVFGEKPNNIVIHRDGFSNEDADWYEHYFKAQGIRYSIIEVRKNVGAKMIEENGGDLNPGMGACIFNENKAFLVTTMMKRKKGSPNPLIIEKNCGDISITDAVTQILYLTQLHVGSVQKPRLPVTTGYADKICKNLDFVPTGKVENKLFFL